MIAKGSPVVRFKQTVFQFSSTNAAEGGVSRDLVKYRCLGHNMAI